MKLILSLALLFVAAPVFGQAVDPTRVKFKGIGLDSTYAQIIKALGKPVTDEPPKKEECIGGREKHVEYEGISFYLMDGDSKDQKTFEVKSFELTTPNMLVSGIKIGDTQARVRKIYGRKYTTSADAEGQTVWFYTMREKDGPGSTRVVFKNGRVAMIAADYQVC